MDNEYKTEQWRARLAQPWTFDRVMRIFFALLVLWGAWWLLDTLKSVLLPFLVAWLIAYLLEPFVQYNRALLRVKRRFLPVFMTLFEACLLLAALSVFLVPSIVDEMHQVSEFIGNYAHGSSTIPFIPESVHQFLRRYIDFDSISAQMRQQDIGTWLDAINSVLASGYNIVMTIFNWFLTLLYVIFIMLDYEHLMRGFKRLVPPKYRGVTYRIAHDIKDSMNHYFRGQALVALCVGVLFCIGFLIIGLPLAVVLGLFIGLLNMVPYLQLISLVPTTLLCLVYSADSGVNFWTIWCETMAVYIIVQCIQDLILTPRIMGKVMGLNPAIILLSLSVWGTLFGFVGLIIALPLTTLIIAYYDIYILTRDDGETPDQHAADSKALHKMIDE